MTDRTAINANANDIAQELLRTEIRRVAQLQEETATEKRLAVIDPTSFPDNGSPRWS